MRLLRPLILLGLLASLVMLAGCPAKVQTEPFTKFHEAVSQVNKQANIIPSALQEGTKQWLAEEVVKNELDPAKKSTVGELMLTFDAPQSDLENQNSFYWKTRSIAYYYELQKMEAAFVRMNKAFLEYATLLKELAGTTFISEKQAIEMTTSINVASKQALTLINSNPDGGISELLSVASVAMIKKYLAHKKRENLFEIITNNQKNIETVCKYMRDGLVLLTIPIIDQYNGEFEQIRNKKIEKKSDVISIIDLNDVTAQSLNTLASLDTLYREIPKAHAELAQAKEEASMTAINNLAVYVLALQTQYEELKAKSTQ